MQYTVEMCHEPFYFLIALSCPFREWFPLLACDHSWRVIVGVLLCQAPISKYNHRVGTWPNVSPLNALILQYQSEQVRQEQNKWLTVIHSSVSITAESRLFQSSYGGYISCFSVLQSSLESSPFPSLATYLASNYFWEPLIYFETTQFLLNLVSGLLLLAINIPCWHTI